MDVSTKSPAEKPVGDGETPTAAATTSPPTVLNIPRVSAPSTAAAVVVENEDASVDDPDESIGEFDDGRSGKLTLSTLIQENLIEPGEGVMSIDYLGQTFKGDLLPAGKIRSQETSLVFNNPSAWAIYCKKIVNPSKKSGCGWASVKYKGRKMDHFKTVWTKMKSQRDAEEAEKRADDAAGADAGEAAGANCQTLAGSLPPPEGQFGLATPTNCIIVRHNQLGLKQPNEVTDLMPPVLVEVDTFASQGKIQPFTLSAASSALLLLDIHTHLSTVPVCGYLGGHWDLNTHNLAITHAFPCLTDPDVEGEEAAKVEFEIYNKIYNKHLSLIGWYRSSPRNPRALPTLKDCEAQLDYQVKLLGNSDATYTPCVGLIVKSFASLQNESDLCFYWVIPPPENSPQEYGKPMKMSYTSVTDPCLSQEVLDQIDSVIQFYKSREKDLVPLHENFNSDTLLVTKMGRSLLPKFPRDQDERLWRYIREKLLGSRNSDLPDPLISQHRAPTNGSAAATTINGHSFRAFGDEEEIDDDDEEEEEEDEEEEEIDDDEENALLRRRRGYRTLSSQSNGGLTSAASRLLPPPPAPPVATTAEVISMLLQKQAPVAPMAHGASTAAAQSLGAGSGADEEAPLDFSSSSHTKHEEADSDEEKLTIHE